MESTYKFIKNVRRGKIETLTIDRPEKSNALSREVFLELKEYFHQIDLEIRESQKREREPNLRGILLTGAGEKAFVAGADISQMSQMTPEEGESFAALAHEVTLLIERLPIPVIACVHGYALGGGCELALSCDFIYASQGAVFGQPEVNLGLIPGFGGCVRLLRLVGVARAREMIYTGKLVSAEEALEIGLANSIFENQEQMMAAAEKTLHLISEKSAHAVGICKKVLRLQAGVDTTEGLRIERQGFREAFEHPDKQKGVSAFLDKKRS